MKTIMLTIPLALSLAAGGASAALPVDPGIARAGQDFAHGGGCRKDSPQGQCCHAGSQPLHCH